MDYTRNMGGAALGARLRRLSERIDAEAARAYAAFGIQFEQRWFGVLNQLVANGPASVGELAKALRITHASVSQTRRSLEAAGIVASAADPADARRRTLELTTQGCELVDRLRPLWEAMEAASLDLNAAAGDAVAILDRLDDALAERSLLERVLSRVSP